MTSSLVTSMSREWFRVRARVSGPLFGEESQPLATHHCLIDFPCLRTSRYMLSHQVPRYFLGCLTFITHIA